MATRKASKRKSSIPQDSLVEKLVHDPNEPARVRVISGFVGNSPRAGHLRLYLDLELKSYIEIEEQEIVHHERLSRERSPLGGTMLWVREEARVEHRPAPATAADFLRGRVARTMRSRVAAGVAGLHGGLGALPRTFSVTECATCPTDDGSHTCVPAVCTLASGCLTTVPTDPGCGGALGGPFDFGPY